ncbi:class I SAM-dependent methyltransferase [Streptomyces sp. NPDC048111]|uniref:class I SAM-dependent methyltransferase n=1 Tax=Streptomyces sp. NPDC048111 TaxID=3365500 RepID=UPI00371AAA14
MAVVLTAFDASERRIWAGRAQAYADSFGRLCAHPVPRLLDAARVRDGVRVLDVGTGTGTVAAAALERGARVTGVDAEVSMVELAARAVPQAEFHLAVLPQLPFSEGLFDAVTGNFVLNHVGRPRAVLAELRRVVRPGGRVALTVWASPAGAGQALLGRAAQAAGASRPPHLPALAADDDFPRTTTGLADLLRSAGLKDVACEPLHWDHRTTAEAWWGGAADGIGTIGQTILSQPEHIRAEIKRRFHLLSAEFALPDGQLALPHAALLAWGRR